MKEVALLKKINACSEAIEWLETQPDYVTAWSVCDRGDWMLWILRKNLQLENEPALRKLTLAKARCAELVLHLMIDERSKKAVEIAISFGEGGATREELDSAASAAYAASASAAYAASASASAAASAAASAHKETLKKCADIVRKIYPTPPPLEACKCIHEPYLLEVGLMCKKCGSFKI